MDITIKYTDLQNYVGNHLSVIGKRAIDKDGKPLYSTVMTSKPEKVVLVDYINSACSKIVSMLTGIIDEAYFDEEDTGVVITLMSYKWADVTDEFALMGDDEQLLKNKIQALYDAGYKYYEDILAEINARTFEGQEYNALFDLDYDESIDASDVEKLNMALEKGYVVKAPEEGKTVTIPSLKTKARGKGVEDIIKNLAIRFVQTYTLSEYLNMFMPEYAKKYETEGVSLLADLKIAAYKRETPKAPQPTYTKRIGQLPSYITIAVGESATIAYTAEFDKKDDIECYAPDNGIVTIERIGDVFEIYGVSEGKEIVELYSHHDTDVHKTIKVTVTEE